MSARPLFPRHRLPEELVLEFLGTFARFEYALKCTNFAASKGGTVAADWDRFADTIDKPFRSLKDKKFNAAVTFLLTEPPRKQVVRGGCVRFVESLPDAGLNIARQTLLMVRRVRNNLFHGAKVWTPEHGGRQRDIDLLKSSLIVLDHCTRLSGEVQIAYEQGIF